MAFQNVISKYGKDYTWDMKVQLMGKQGQECAEIIVKALELPLTPNEFISETKKHFEVLFPNVDLMPGYLFECLFWFAFGIDFEIRF